jgi:hypothetical protein
MLKSNDVSSLLSSPDSLKYFKSIPSEGDVINILSDLKHRVFPRPFERLSKLRNKKRLVGAEIGVCGGEHALSLLRTFDLERLYLIDPYSMYEDYTEGYKHYGADQKPLRDTEDSAKLLLEEYASRVVWVKELSASATKFIAEDLDFVYIDGNHAENFVKEDIENYYPLVKSGGVIGGHDFYNGFQLEHDGVISAVIEWASKNNHNLKVELPDWWVEK